MFILLFFNRLFCKLCIETNESTVLKNSLILIVLTIIFGACLSLNKMANDGLCHAIVGQNKMTVRSRLGTPERTVFLKEIIISFYNENNLHY